MEPENISEESPLECVLLCFCTTKSIFVRRRTLSLFFTGQRRIVPGGIRSRGVPSSEVDGPVPSAGEVDMRLPEKGNSNSHGARPVYFNHLDDEVDS